MKAFEKTLCIVAMTVALVAGCATLQQHQTTIDAIASDAGYAAYRAVPKAQPVLEEICSLGDITDPAQLQTALKESLGKVWNEAANLTTTDAQMAVMGLNNLVGFLGLQEQSQVGMDIMKNAVAGLCQGVKLAEGGVTKQ